VIVVALCAALLALLAACDIDKPVTPGTALATTTPITVNIGKAEQKAFYRVSITQADIDARKVIASQLTSSTLGSGDHRILAPNGSVLVGGSTTGSTIVSPAVTEVGTYSVLINPNGANTGTATLKVIKPIDVNVAVTPATTLAGASPIALAVPNPGQNAYYRVSITQADIDAKKVIASQLTSSTLGSGDHRILAPNGSVLVGGSTTGSTIVSPPVTEVGTYRVLIDPNGPNTGTATVKIIKPVDVDVAVTPAATLAGASPIAVALPTPGQRAYYRVTITQADVTAGRRIASQLSASSLGSGDHRILAPNGTILTGGSTTGSTVVSSPVTVTGTYRVLVDPNGPNTGTATLRVAYQA